MVIQQQQPLKRPRVSKPLHFLVTLLLSDFDARKTPVHMAVRTVTIAALLNKNPAAFDQQQLLTKSKSVELKIYDLGPHTSLIISNS